MLGRERVAHGNDDVGLVWEVGGGYGVVFARLCARAC